MPSNEHLNAIESALNGAGESFRLAVDSTVKEVRKLIADQKESQSGLEEYTRAELGMFAQGRINVEQFTALLPRQEAIDQNHMGDLERAAEILRDAESELRGVRLATVAPGGLMTDAVEDALRQVGRALGAARVVGLIKTGGYNPAVHSTLFQGLPFRVWTKAERLIAPPLLINVHGSDLNAGTLSKYVDGNMKIVLSCRGACPSAPLVRLITPRVFVMQTKKPGALSAMMQWQGPGVALVAEDCATFVHDPSGGPALEKRLTVDSLPPNPKQSIGGITVRQQLEELEQLAVLSGLSSVATPAVPAGEGGSKKELPPDPADKLAAWLLSQARDVSST